MKIDFLKNGMEIHYENYKQFVPYHAIARIDDVEVRTNYRDFVLLAGRFTGDYVMKNCIFDIQLLNGEKISIYDKNDTKSFPRLPDYSSWPMWKRILISGTNREGLSDDAAEWLKDKKRDMENSIEKMTELRNEIIENFNKWNYCNGKNKR